MSSNLIPRTVQMAPVVLTKLKVEAGNAPETEDFDVSLSISAGIGDSDAAPNIKKLAMDISLSSPGTEYYSIEATAEAVFSFDYDAGEEYMSEYLAQYAPNELFAAAAAAIRAATASFPYGSAIIPGFNISLDPEKIGNGGTVG